MVYEDEPELASLHRQWRVARGRMVRLLAAHHRAFDTATSQNPTDFGELLRISDVAEQAAEAAREWLDLGDQYLARSRQYCTARIEHHQSLETIDWQLDSNDRQATPDEID